MWDLALPLCCKIGEVWKIWITLMYVQTWNLSYKILISTELSHHPDLEFTTLCSSNQVILSLIKAADLWTRGSEGFNANSKWQLNLQGVHLPDYYSMLSTVSTLKGHHHERQVVPHLMNQRATLYNVQCGHICQRVCTKSFLDFLVSLVTLLCLFKGKQIHLVRTQLYL